MGEVEQPLEASGINVLEPFSLKLRSHGYRQPVLYTESPAWKSVVACLHAVTIADRIWMRLQRHLDLRKALDWISLNFNHKLNSK